MNKSSKLVQGIGTKGTEYPTIESNKKLKEYILWCNMLLRCKEKYWNRHPSYAGTTCSENFKSYSYFYRWCQEQIGFNDKSEKGRSWCLDKDLLVKGNKAYSENTCVFIPHRVNCLLIKQDSTRGGYPIGVYWKKKNNQFCVQCADGSGSQKYLGLFTNYSEAFKVYKDFKEKHIKSLAEEHKHQLDPRAYEALMNYQVQETD